ncbi:hypothetical protein, partial [Faecalibaculum rodentium]|uniref:hypothetical protein n=1 Tax=Faecalibaculum rodentium TaxID=1702221 RepID=UPI0025B747C6
GYSMATLARQSIQLENPSVGGRNLLRNTGSLPIGAITDHKYGTWSSNSQLTATTDGIKMTYCGTNAAQGLKIPIAFEGCVGNNETVTLSFEYRGNPPSASDFYFLQKTGFNVLMVGLFTLVHDETNWQKCSVTFSNAQANIRICTAVLIAYAGTDASKWIEIKKGSLKLEKGNMATDWTPAPEDVDSAISALDDKTIANATALEQRLSTQILQSQEQIQQTVTEQYFTKDETNRLIQEVSTAFTQTAEGWQMDFNKLVSVVNANQASTDSEFQNWSKYIRFVDGNIILGQVQNPIILTIKNDRISFAQSGQEVAYLSNSELTITDARITHSLRIGYFGWVPRANGSLDLKKVS